ncbi:MAG: CmcJ/NvfI family oxidoreductase [Acidobacteriota bacterium]|nr:CmcJ/NvfI family oxidoreductase [Acidobacteriota bacterium]
MSATVNAQVRYLKPEWKGRDEIPALGDRESRRALTAKWDVDVHDARGMDLDLDVDGFLLTNHESAVADFHDEAEVEKIYYPEAKQVIRRLTGADHVFITQHVVRTEDKSDFNTAYARFVHCDYTKTDLRKVADKTLGYAGIDPAETADWDFAWYNTWQPVDREVQQNPLALVSAASLDEGDVVDYYFTGYKHRALTAMPVYNPDHRFFYFPRMQTDEVLIIKQLDSREGRACSCPHTSFDLANPDGPLGRRSVEVRLMCAFTPPG